jgi:hypothetical protein
MSACMAGTYYNCPFQCPFTWNVHVALCCVGMHVELCCVVMCCMLCYACVVMCCMLCYAVLWCMLRYAVLWCVAWCVMLCCAVVLCCSSLPFCVVLLWHKIPHRASLKNMPGHGGNRTHHLWNTSHYYESQAHWIAAVKINTDIFSKTIKFAYINAKYMSCAWYIVVMLSIIIRAVIYAWYIY